MSDKTTTLMERDRLSELIHATVNPATAVSANTIPRSLIDKQSGRTALPGNALDRSERVSPVAVIVVLAMLVVLFVAIVRL